MYLAYYDEAGDDGYPKYSSPIFVLTCLYLYHADWKESFDVMRQFRSDLRDRYGLPVKEEIHTKQLLLGKNPYRQYGLTDDQRVEMVDVYSDLIASLPVRAVNVVINKATITSSDYEVLDRALTYSIQRVENDLGRINPENRFLIITDFGRVGKMNKTARRVRAINYIPSMFGPQPYRREIRSLIEDPLPKDSKESYFIQSSDLISYVVYLHKLARLSLGSYSNRMPSAVTPSKVDEWLRRLSPSLNFDASRPDPYGIVAYPR